MCRQMSPPNAPPLPQMFSTAYFHKAYADIVPYHDATSFVSVKKDQQAQNHKPHIIRISFLLLKTINPMAFESPSSPLSLCPIHHPERDSVCG